MCKRFRDFRASRGSPQPMGLSRVNKGLNFALFSRHARRVTLVLGLIDGSPAGEMVEIELDREKNRTGDIWHLLLLDDPGNFCYGFRVETPEPTPQTYATSQILLDPYAKALLPRRWGEPGHYGKRPCCLELKADFDWGEDRPPKTPLSETIIYELHVRGFTRSPTSKTQHPGTFAGLVEKIPYLKELGITAVELLPVTAFDENNTDLCNPFTGENLKNFWGYSPLSFFALNSSYAHQPKRAAMEFKTMVRALHQAGIEIYLDMVFNHSGEGDYQGDTSSFRGLDNTVYYHLDRQGEYLNYSGCGNTVNCNHPVVRDLILDSLRYWVIEMHVDGFRFDLASIFTRDRQGKIHPEPPLLESIAEDPVLRNAKLIAEVWDAAGVYQLGSFAKDPRWSELNGRFRDDIRAFMAGKRAGVADLATRIAGSSDLYQKGGKSPLNSINFIACHDGFTLQDLVSYNHKHNLGNGEENRDGESHNLSWNSGVEGESDIPEINRLRIRRIKGMIMLLLLSQGVPLISAGDEFGKSQKGNNNCWCQDNEIGWLDWSLLKKNAELYHFFKQCIVLRKNYPLFRRKDFFSHMPGEQDGDGIVSWQFLRPGEQNWSRDCQGLAYLLSTQGERDSDAFFIMLNGYRDRSLYFTAPPCPGQGLWRAIINTASHPPDDICQLAEAKEVDERRIALPSLSCRVLQKARHS